MAARLIQYIGNGYEWRVVRARNFHFGFGFSFSREGTGLILTQRTILVHTNALISLLFYAQVHLNNKSQYNIELWQKIQVNLGNREELAMHNGYMGMPVESI